MGPNRIPRPAGERGQLHERPARGDGGVHRPQEHGHARPRADPVQQRTLDRGRWRGGAREDGGVRRGWKRIFEGFVRLFEGLGRG